MSYECIIPLMILYLYVFRKSISMIIIGIIFVCFIYRPKCIVEGQDKTGKSKTGKSGKSEHKKKSGKSEHKDKHNKKHKDKHKKKHKKKHDYYGHYSDKYTGKHDKYKAPSRNEYLENHYKKIHYKWSTEDELNKLITKFYKPKCSLHFNVSDKILLKAPGLYDLSVHPGKSHCYGLLDKKKIKRKKI